MRVRRHAERRMGSAAMVTTGSETAPQNATSVGMTVIHTTTPDVVVASVSWLVLLTGFDRHQRAANRSPGTIRLYRYRLQDLAAVNPRPALITTSDLEQMLSNDAWGAETRKNVRTSYRAFFSWARRAGHLPHDPAADLPSITVPAGVARPAPEKVVKLALREASARELFMVQLGAYGGLRCCEIAVVHGDDWDGTWLYVVGKGSKSRRVPIKHRGLVRTLDDLNGWAFPNRWTGEPITAGHVTKLLSATLRDTWTGHTLRHRFGTTTLNRTKDILAVGKVLGHSRPETTQRYCIVDEDRLLAVGAAAA